MPAGNIFIMPDTRQNNVIVDHEENFKSKSNKGVLKDLFSGKSKRKPIDVKINNDVRKEPKISLLKDAKYSEEQRFRRYKTKVEPELKAKITQNEDDDIVSKLKEAFGLPNSKTQNKNSSTVETASVSAYKVPVEPTPEETKFYVDENFVSAKDKHEYQRTSAKNELIAINQELARLQNDFSDMTADDTEELTGLISQRKGARVIIDKYRNYKLGDTVRNDFKSVKEQSKSTSKYLMKQEPLLQTNFDKNGKYAGITQVPRSSGSETKIKTARTPVAKSSTATPSSVRDTPMVGTPSREVEFGGKKTGGKKLNFTPSDDLLTPLSSAKKKGRPLGSTNKKKLGIKETFSGT